MQTITILIALTALILFTVHQHLALKKLYKKTQAQDERNERQDNINSAFASEIKRLKAEAPPRPPVKLPELPPFINQPQTRYFVEVKHHAN